MRRKNIAILCGGLDSVLRGYETHTRMLFDVLDREKANFNFILYKRDGNSKHNEIPLKSPYRYGFLCSRLGKLRGGHLYWESVLFSLYFFMRIFVTQKKFDTI